MKAAVALPKLFLPLSIIFCFTLTAILFSGCTAPVKNISAVPTTSKPTLADIPEPADTNPSKPTQARPSLNEPTSEPPLTILPPENLTIERYGLMEFNLQTTLQVNNPYNPDEIDIRVQFTAPSGKISEVGAFWYQGYDLTRRTPNGKPGWKVRFTPVESGAWSAVARIASQGLASEPIGFRVIDSESHGFVRINPSNPRYFAFDDGSFFFPIGLNMAWWSGAGDALTDYEKWLEPFSVNGGNAIRVWMAEWSFGIEWKDTPLGDYTNRLYKAWLLDQIFAMAEKQDIYIMLVLLNCADFNNWQTKGWDANPYNAANGGPLERPSQFVTDLTARDLLNRRLKYIVNRWGYSTHLMAWEWWNEVNLSGIPDDLLYPWYQEETAYLKSVDVNKHLVTNSYAISDSPTSWLMPEMEIIQKHEYAQQEKATNKDLAERVVADFQTLVAGAPPKPALLGEFGYGDEGWGTEIDKSGIHLHNGIWATTFAGYAGSGMYWWWDVYVERYRAWQHFYGLHKFIENMDLAAYQPFSPLHITSADGSPAQEYGLGLRGEDILVWIRSNGYTVQAAGAAREGKADTFVYLPPVVDGHLLTLTDMVEGEYTVKWFNPQNGQWMDEVMIATQGHMLTIPIPSFRSDLAAKITHNP